MYKNVLQYRGEYNKALGRFSACRHLSKMNEVYNVHVYDYGAQWITSIYSVFLILHFIHSEYTFSDLDT